MNKWPLGSVADNRVAECQERRNHVSVQWSCKILELHMVTKTGRNNAKEIGSRIFLVSKSEKRGQRARNRTTQPTIYPNKKYFLI